MGIQKSELKGLFGKEPAKIRNIYEKEISAVDDILKKSRDERSKLKEKVDNLEQEIKDAKEKYNA